MMRRIEVGVQHCWTTVGEIRADGTLSRETKEKSRPACDLVKLGCSSAARLRSVKIGALNDSTDEQYDTSGRAAERAGGGEWRELAGVESE